MSTACAIKKIVKPVTEIRTFEPTRKERLRGAWQALRYGGGLKGAYYHLTQVWKEYEAQIITDEVIFQNQVVVSPENVKWLVIEAKKGYYFLGNNAKEGCNVRLRSTPLDRVPKVLDGDIWLRGSIVYPK